MTFSDVPAAQAARAIEVVVESPYENGCEHVSMVDPIVAMARQGRLTVREVAAADRYRKAFDAVHAGGCSAIALDPIDGRRGEFVTDRKLRGARDLQTASRALGPLERYLRELLGEGATLEDIGRRLGENNARSARAAGSAVVRAALSTLADAWS